MNLTSSAIYPHGVRGHAPLDSTVPQLIATVAMTSPDTLALDFADGAVTYRELCLRAGQLAEQLAAAGVGRGDVVGILDFQSSRQVIALLAVLQLGAGYLPLDPANPLARQQLLVDRAGAELVLADERCEAAAGWQSLDRMVALAEAAPPCAESTWRYPPGEAEDRAYVMFTSGSTGRPKGVMASHRAISHLVVGTDYVDIRPGDVVAFGSNIAFDAVTFEIWGALLNGAVVHGLDRDVLLSTYSLRNYLAEHRISAMFMTTALFHLHARLSPGNFAPLKHLLVGGEAMNPDAARAVLAADPPRRLRNVYGPTEATTFSTTHRILSVPDDVASIPIGRPIANASAHILDEFMQPLPVDTIGELYIGGPGLALGYCGEPALTADRFVPDPVEPSRRLYRTGDHARWTEDHLLDFAGRRDDQVKIRGFRIELSEVEGALSALPAVREAAVVVHGTGEAKSLIAFVVPVEPGAGAGIGRALAPLLPPQQIPAAVLELDRMPLNANGKLDRAALRQRIAQDPPGVVR